MTWMGILNMKTSCIDDLYKGNYNLSSLLLKYHTVSRSVVYFFVLYWLYTYMYVHESIYVSRYHCYACFTWNTIIHLFYFLHVCASSFQMTSIFCFSVIDIVWVYVVQTLYLLSFQLPPIICVSCYCFHSNTCAWLSQLPFINQLNCFS